MNLNKRSRIRAGFTLLELAIAMIVFLILAMGITSAALHARKIAHHNILKNTAHTIAQGYLEQIKSISRTDIENAINDPAGTPLPTQSVSAIDVGSVAEHDPLFLNGPEPAILDQADGSNHKEILIDLIPVEGGTDEELTMDMWLDLDINSIGTNSYEVRILFVYESRGYGGGPNRGSVRMIIADLVD